MGFVDGIGSKKIQQVFGEELPKLVKELQRIENIRKYVGGFLFFFG